jgi:hypothetical protein
MEQSVLQGTMQGSAAASDKRPNTDSAGSQMSRRRLNKIVSSNVMPNAIYQESLIINIQIMMKL